MEEAVGASGATIATTVAGGAKAGSAGGKEILAEAAHGKDKLSIQTKEDESVGSVSETRENGIGVASKPGEQQEWEKTEKGGGIRPPMSFLERAQRSIARGLSPTSDFDVSDVATPRGLGSSALLLATASSSPKSSTNTPIPIGERSALFVREEEEEEEAGEEGRYTQTGKVQSLSGSKGPGQEKRTKEKRKGKGPRMDLTKREDKGSAFNNVDSLRQRVDAFDAEEEKQQKGIAELKQILASARESAFVTAASPTPPPPQDDLDNSGNNSGIGTINASGDDVWSPRGAKAVSQYGTLGVTSGVDDGLLGSGDLSEVRRDVGIGTGMGRRETAFHHGESIRNDGGRVGCRHQQFNERRSSRSHKGVRNRTHLQKGGQKKKQEQGDSDEDEDDEDRIPSVESSVMLSLRTVQCNPIFHEPTSFHEQIHIKAHQHIDPPRPTSTQLYVLSRGRASEQAAHQPTDRTAYSQTVQFIQRNKLLASEPIESFRRQPTDQSDAISCLPANRSNHFVANRPTKSAHWPICSETTQRLVKSPTGQQPIECAHRLRCSAI